MADTLTITDNRTGKQYEIPIQDGTIRAMDLRQIKVTPDEFGMMTYDPAFMNTAACRSRITFIDGDKGVLLVPRLPDRAAGRAQRLPRNRLPDPVRRAADRGAARSSGPATSRMHTMLHTNISKLMEGFQHDAHPMGMFISTVGALSTFYPRRQEHLLERIAAAADHPADRQGADDCRLCLPALDRPARTTCPTTTSATPATS